MRSANYSTELLANVGAAIREKRRDLGLSQEELARLAGLHRNAIGKIERGEVDPALTSLNHIYPNLGCVAVRFDVDVILPWPLAGGLPITPGEFSPARMMRMIGAAVRERRRALGCSLKELAAHAGIHPNTIWNVERGLVDPSLTITQRLYRGLGVQVVTADSERVHLFSRDFSSNRPIRSA
jgi:transcriptional regulator with XRE-family HTH domain